MNPDLFAGTRGPTNARVMVIAESWGRAEDEQGRPLVGASGKLHDRIMREEAGLDTTNIFHTNVVNARPAGNDIKNFFYPTADAKAAGRQPLNGLYPRDIVLEGLAALHAQIEAVNPDLIIAYGNYALWALKPSAVRIANHKDVGEPGYKAPRGILDWAGSWTYTDAGRRLIPLVHPATCFRDPRAEGRLRYDVHARVRPAPTATQWEPNWNFLLRPNYHQLYNALSDLWLRAENYPITLACDIETYRGGIFCLALASSATDAISIPIMSTETEDNNYWTFTEEYHLLKFLRALLSHRNVTVVGQNFDYDVQHMALSLQIRPPKFHDTMTAEHVMFPGEPKGLDDLSRKYCAIHAYWKSEGKDWDPRLHEPEREWAYNCQDSCRTWEVHMAQLMALKHYGLMDCYEWKLREQQLALNMTFRGIPVDLRTRAALGQELDTYLKDCAAFFERLMPSFCLPELRTARPAKWYNSTTQQIKLFYECLQLPRQTKTYKGKRTATVEDEALSQLALLVPDLAPMFETLQSYRSARTLKSNVIVKPLSPDNRMRCHYKVTGTKSHRWASEEDVHGNGTNLQNITEGDEEE